VSRVICQILNLYVLIVFGRIIMSWFPVRPGGLAAQLYSVLYALTEPVLGPIRRTIPSIGMFDLSPLIVIFGAQIICGIIR
jgi:YggT family protein